MSDRDLGQRGPHGDDQSVRAARNTIPDCGGDTHRDAAIPTLGGWRRRRGTPLRTSVPAAPLRRRYAVCSGLEIARPVEIGDQPGLPRLPTQQFSSSLARGQFVDRCERREPAEMLGSFVGGLADHRHAPAAADHANDVSERLGPRIPRRAAGQAELPTMSRCQRSDSSGRRR